MDRYAINIALLITKFLYEKIDMNNIKKVDIRCLDHYIGSKIKTIL
ncbi:hypothetical Protein YC6258_03915 [Gynuella sunshinyii YC6258]|uniref:Uncharacterized protein n=1 Tax=Gynuella sunshinyii YC6258 TaxID=1445510 RepID=A0A0C5VNR5_9GAMM|nr:hypothetical Protein YC6258_03915 [Gynuella sunshinyii YC6258]